MSITAVSEIHTVWLMIMTDYTAMILTQHDIKLQKPEKMHEHNTVERVFAGLITLNILKFTYEHIVRTLKVMS